eukprot:4930940-Prymnesium_polylepis.1
MPRPAVSSHVHGETPAAAYAKMNRVLQEQPVRTASCESFEHASLNNVTRVLHSLRSPDLQDFFASKGDRRKLHFDSLDYKEALWKAEEAAATLMPSHAPGGPVYNASREGKCAEAVMLWIHHLSEAQRTILAQLEAFTLPLMPHDVAPKEMRSTEYDQQIGCTSCHVAVHIPGTPPSTAAGTRECGRLLHAVHTFSRRRRRAAAIFACGSHPRGHGRSRLSPADVASLSRQSRRSR